MNVYDFDKTIYAGDSSIDFWLFCLRKHPRAARRCFAQAAAAAQYAVGGIDAREMKEQFFSFLTFLDNPRECAVSFWQTASRRIMPWYLRQKEPTDVIISASPEFLLRPICATLSVEPPIATRMEVASGRIDGPNCKGPEKVVRFRESYPNGCIQRFYSDSLSDAPLAQLAEEAFIVRRNTCRSWPGQRRL